MMPPNPYDLIYSDDCTNQQLVRCYNRHYFRIVKSPFHGMMKRLVVEEPAQQGEQVMEQTSQEHELVKDF
jgi:hypothetical protein